MMDGWRLMETQRVCLRELCLITYAGFRSLTLSLYNIDKKSDEDENLPSMDTLEICPNKPIQSISSYFGGDDEDDVPDMSDYLESDNLIETDAVSDIYFFATFFTLDVDGVFVLVKEGLYWLVGDLNELDSSFFMP